MRILLLESDPLTSHSLRTILKDHNHQVVVRYQISEALPMIGKERFDAIVSNYQMPDGSGSALYQLISRMDVELAKRIIFLSDKRKVSKQGDLGWSEDSQLLPMSVDGEHLEAALVKATGSTPLSTQKKPKSHYRPPKIETIYGGSQGEDIGPPSPSDFPPNSSEEKILDVFFSVLNREIGKLTKRIEKLEKRIKK